MAEQTKILTKTPAYAGTAKKQEWGQSTTADANLAGKVGTLALGKPGDIIERAYGPVTKDATITTDTAEFGAYVEGKGILVNSNDCAGISSDAAKPFDTTTLKKGQVGTFLISGACVVKKSQVAAIAAAMKVQELDLTDYQASTADDVLIIGVNGFDNDTVRSSSL